jgi:hypothetical protein
MSKDRLHSTLVSLMVLAAAPRQAQAPAIEVEGDYAHPTPRLAERAARPARACISTVCMLPMPDRNAVEGRRENLRGPDDMDAPSGAVASGPLEPMRPESYR